MQRKPKIVKSNSPREKWWKNRPLHNRPAFIHSNPTKLDHIIKFNKHLDQVLPNIQNMKIAVVAHLYYCDFWQELCQYLRNIPIPFDLYVTMVEGHECQLEECGFKPKQVFVLPNKGFDVGPFIHTINNIDLSRYDFVCKVHSKKSVHRTDPASGERWRQVLISSVLGSSVRVATILDEMNRNKIGLVGSREHVISILNSTGEMEENIKPVLKRLLDMYGIQIHRYHNPQFIGGTVFWVRSEILHRLKHGRVLFDMFEPVQASEELFANQIAKDGKIRINDVVYDIGSRLAIDGQLAHGMERLFGALSVSMDYRIVGV